MSSEAVRSARFLSGRGYGAVGAVAAIACLCLCVGGCGSGEEKRVLARVGSVAITKGEVDSRASALKAGWVSQAAPKLAGSPEERALRSLLEGVWLIGEAHARGVTLAPAEVRGQLVVVRSEGFPANSPKDLAALAEAELARAKLKALAIAQQSAPSHAAIAAYYAKHKRDFHLPGYREARFRNRKTMAAVLKLKREVEGGKSLTSPQQEKVGELFTGAQVPPGKGNEYEAAIDSAKPHTLAGPFKIHNDYWLYEVVKVTPARQLSLAQAAAEIKSKLIADRRASALRRAAQQWEARWSARTSCIAKTVVPGCSAYRGAGVALSAAF